MRLRLHPLGIAEKLTTRFNHINGRAGRAHINGEKEQTYVDRSSPSSAQHRRSGIFRT